jgi:ATP-binding protein involved in chromosome partitioning
MPASSSVSQEAVRTALDTVLDPEIRRPITELGMVRSVEIADGTVTVNVLLTIAGCPMRSAITRDVTAAVSSVPGVDHVEVELGVMSDEQREELKQRLRGGAGRENPFSSEDCRTVVFAVASGKGGVGKSSITVNLAVALASQGLAVGVLDADVHGFSIPRMLGVTTPPTQVDGALVPPVAHDVKVISIGMFVPGNKPVVWRGPMLHRALEQFLTDVLWGDLDVLLLDLPPGTGDIAISTAKLLPDAEIIVVTTPQTAAAEVAERAGSIAGQTHQHIAGVIENMSWLTLPDGSRMEIFGSGGGQAVAESLSAVMGDTVELLGQVPLDTSLREGGDSGVPVAVAAPDGPAGRELHRIATLLAKRTRR